MSIESSDPGHGNSTAAWTAVVIMLVAVVVGTAAFALSIAWLVWACAGLFVVGFLVGWVLKLLGYGVRGSKTLAKAH